MNELILVIGKKHQHSPTSTTDETLWQFFSDLLEDEGEDVYSLTEDESYSLYYQPLAGTYEVYLNSPAANQLVASGSYEAAVAA